MLCPITARFLTLRLRGAKLCAALQAQGEGLSLRSRQAIRKVSKQTLMLSLSKYEGRGDGYRSLAP
jgi:hypothetical protein